MSYVYEPDPVKRREQRRERLGARFAHNQPASDIFENCHPALASADPLHRLRDELTIAAQLISVGADDRPMMFDVYGPEIYEIIADWVIEHLEHATLAVKNLSADVPAATRLSIAGVIGKTQRICAPLTSDGYAHKSRELQQVELPADYWQTKFRSIRHEVHDELLKTADRIFGLSVVANGEGSAGSPKPFDPRRRGRLTKEESKIKHAQYQALVGQHPSLTGDPEQVAREIGGVSSSTIRRWIDEDEKKYRESVATHRRPEDADD